MSDDTNATVERVLLAAPRGFCAGVEMAIKALAWMVRAFDGPVYCYHEIVHNQQVVQRFEEQGVVFVDDVAEVPPGGRSCCRRTDPRPRSSRPPATTAGSWSATVCPLVTKSTTGEGPGEQGLPDRLHRPRGPRGGGRHHGRRPRAIHRVESVEESTPYRTSTPRWRCWPDHAVAPRLGRRRLGDRRAVPDVWTPGRSDLCFATTNRQSALMEIAPRCDAMVVIGSANSSNTVALERLARGAGCATVLRINTADELPRRADGSVDLHGVVGVTAGRRLPRSSSSRSSPPSLPGRVEGST